MKQDPVYYKSYYERTKNRKLSLGSAWYRRQISDPDAKAKFKTAKRDYQRQRYANDPKWRARNKYKKMLQGMLRGRKYSEATVFNLVGCTVPELRLYLERRFKSGMSWENFGINGWVVDHIIPCSKFDLTSYPERHQCFHYTNLQPLWYEQNRRKCVSTSIDYGTP